jgi:hypothetical protein
VLANLDTALSRDPMRHRTNSIATSASSVSDGALRRSGSLAQQRLASLVPRTSFAPDLVLLHWRPSPRLRYHGVLRSQQHGMEP